MEVVTSSLIMGMLIWCGLALFISGDTISFGILALVLVRRKSMINLVCTSNLFETCWWSSSLDT